MTQAPTARISASIVLHKTSPSEIERLWQSLEKSTIQPAVTVLDNSPEPIQFARPLPSNFTYLRVENRGYGAGHNVALRKALTDSDYHFVLNPDVYFQPDALERMIAYMEAHPDVGHLMPRITHADGSLQYLCKLIPSPADMLLRRFAFGPLRDVLRRRTERFELRFTGYDREMDVPYLSGCFMLLRSTALQRAGLFDERFFLYPEDIDLTRRMHAVARTVFYPGVTVVHDHAKASYRDRSALKLHMQNMIRYFNKWGWLLDSERRRINKETLRRLKS